jgi:hypothetical protein
MVIDFDKQETRLTTVLRSCSPENRRVARMWLFYTGFYWMFPTLTVIFGLWLAKRHVRWVDLVIHGEFLIYAITIVAGSTRLVAKDLPNRDPFVSRQGFNLVSHVMIFPAIFAYGLLRYIGATSNSYDVSAPLVVTYSIVLLLAAFIFSYIVFLIDAQRSTPNELPKRVAAAIAHAPDKINEEFTDLQIHDPNAPAAVAVQEAVEEIDELEEPSEEVAILEIEPASQPPDDADEEHDEPGGAQ